MNGFNRNKLKYKVNESFFDDWSSQMAYLLGFTFADGNIHSTSLSWDLQLRDEELLHQINKALKSNYPIIVSKRGSCRLRLNNQVLIGGAVKRGLLPKKNIRSQLPQIPHNLLSHFVRGYIDGDGWLIIRDTKHEFDLGFCGANKNFLKDLVNVITHELDLNSIPVRKRLKVTPNRITSTTYMVEYYSSNAFKIAGWLYENLKANDLYLPRKFEKYQAGKEMYNFKYFGSRKITPIQKQLRRPIADVLNELFIEKKYDGVKIAKLLGVHSSSIYRWLAKSEIKYPVKRVGIYGQNN